MLLRLTVRLINAQFAIINFIYECKEIMKDLRFIPNT